MNADEKARRRRHLRAGQVLTYSLVAAVVCSVVAGVEIHGLWAAPVALLIMLWAIAGAVLIFRGKGMA